jgi:catechol 2,3-dioxygenase-like lactoylglutathione lyase family enzyme
MIWNSLVPELTVSNFQKSLSFYVDLIGFEIKYKRDDPKFAYLEYELSQIMIEEYHKDGWGTGKLEQPYGRGINFQIECNNVEKLQKRILKNKYDIFRNIKENWYNTGNDFVGNKEFLVQDPDGYLLRFSEDLGTKFEQPTTSSS